MRKTQSTTSRLISFALISAGSEIAGIKRTLGRIGKADSGNDRNMGRKIKENGGNRTGLLLSFPLPLFMKNRFVSFVCQFILSEFLGK